jgi:hypothetical protein
MNDKDFAKDHRRREKERWLRLADSYLRTSGNEFLEGFCHFLEEGYKNSKQADHIFHEPSWATERQILLKEMLDFEAFRSSSMQAKGCALIGKTVFNKLDFIKNYFMVCGLSEFTGGETAGRYVVVDCSGINGYSGLVNSLVKNQDVTYVIFDNCDSLLRHDSALKTFKQLCEDYPGITLITKDDKSINFRTESSFVFLGEENTLHVAVEKQAPNGIGTSEYNNLDAFIHYIHVYDFDRSERYHGHDIAPIYS